MAQQTSNCWELEERLCVRNEMLNGWLYESSERKYISSIYIQIVPLQFLFHISQSKFCIVTQPIECKQKSNFPLENQTTTAQQSDVFSQKQILQVRSYH